MKIGILIVSDTRTIETDESGKVIAVELKKLGYEDIETQIVKDDQVEIVATLKAMASECLGIFTTGGTGFTERDVTPEATASVVTKRADSLSELIRAKGKTKTPYASLSRGIAGVYNKTLIVNLPGSVDGAKVGISAIGFLLKPIFAQLQSGECPVK